MNNEFLYDAFNTYFNKGIKAKEEGNIELAADTLKKLAAVSTGELKRTRQERVLKIIDERLDQIIEQK